MRGLTLMYGDGAATVGFGFSLTANIEANETGGHKG